MKSRKVKPNGDVEERKLNALLERTLRGMKPPEDLTVSEWADKKRILSPESSAETGPWRTSRTPYLKEPMDAFTDPKVRRIVLVSSSQVGKSEVLNNVIGYIIDEDPGSILFVQPKDTTAQEYSRLRIAPMIRDCSTLRKKVGEVKSRDSSNTVKQKAYPGGILTMCGSNEADALASKPIRYILGDELDRWAASAGKEGDPWKLATARQITFYNAKSVAVSTPTVKNASKIADLYAEGTMERWCVQCPHCGEYNDIKYTDIRYEYREETVNGKKQYYIESLLYMCPECACASTEQELKKQPAKWIADNPEAYKKGIRSFWLNSFVSPWASWESTFLEYLEAIGDTKKLQVVFNTRFGELWEDRGDIQDEDSLMQRREDYEAEVPDGVLLLTCGVDTQDDRLEYEIVGWGHFSESWGIKRGIIMGRPDDESVWEQLDDVLDKVYRYEDGLGLRISVTFVDEGGHFTMEVRNQCRKRQGKNVFAIKGRGGPDIPYLDTPKKQKIMIQNRYIGACWQYVIGVDSGKQVIMDNLKVQEPGSKYCHFPKRADDKRDDYGPSYFKGLLSEHKTYDKTKKQPWQWKKIPGHERNEPLDLRNYAQAAFRASSKDLDAIDRRLKAARSKKGPPTAAPSPAVQRGGQPKAKAKGSALKKYYDDW